MDGQPAPSSAAGAGGAATSEARPAADEDRHSERSSHRSNSRGSRDAAEDDEEDELAELEQKGSIYSYIMVLPPVTKMQFGHYFSKEVGVGCSVFVICIMLQLCLTLIAGEHILHTQTEQRLMLVQQAEMSETYLSVMWHWIESRPEVELTEGLQSARKRMSERLEAGEWTEKAGQIFGAASYDPKRCCSGPGCASFRTQCCKPTQPGGAVAASSLVQRAAPNASAAGASAASSPRSAPHALPPRGDLAAQRAALNASQAAAPRLPPSGDLVAQHAALNASKAPLPAAPTVDDALLPLFLLRGRKPGGGGGGGHGGGGHGAHGKKAQDQAEKKGTADDEAAPQLQPSCVFTDGMLSCLSPTAAAVVDWGSFDTDGDGVWTLEEAEADVMNLGCHLGSPLVDLFRSAILGLKQDAWDTTVAKESRLSSWQDKLPPAILESKAIPEDYFLWWRGLVGMCQYGTFELCEDMLKRGTFSGLLQEDRAFMRGGVHDLDSSLKYCKRLLQSGGICDDALPGTYAVYRERIEDSCGASVHFLGPRIQNPHEEKDAMPLMTASFTRVEEMTYVHSKTFRFFMWLIIMMWYINLLGEFQELIQFWDFLSAFPVTNEWPILTPQMREKLRTMSKSLSTKFSFKSAASRSGVLGDEVGSDDEQGAGSGGAADGGPVLERYSTGIEASGGPGVPSERQPLVARGSRTRSGFFRRQRSPGGSYAATGASAAADSRQSSKEAASESALGVARPLFVRQGNDGKLHIKEFARPHYMMCICTAGLRTTILFVLMYAGTYFLLSNHSLLDLLLNALALAFILELDEFTFEFLIPTKDKDLLEKMEPLRYKSRLPGLGKLFKLATHRVSWGLFLIPVLSMVVVQVHDRMVVQPMLEALECFCLKTGDHCLATSLYDQSAFDEHWSLMAQLEGRSGR